MLIDYGYLDLVNKSTLQTVMKNKKMNLETSYVLKNEINVDTNDGKPRNFGILTGKGISDHLPVVAEIKIN